jgi:hypothetical protein
MRLQDLFEFAPDNGDDREPDEEEILRQLAARWWLGTEQQMAQAQRTLATMGWEIGPVESGDDDAGVFLIRPGDENGDTYIAFNHSDLSLDESSLNELSSDLLNRSAQMAKDRSNQAMDPKVHDALGGGYMNPLAKHYDSLSQKLSNRAAKVGKRDAVKQIASPAVMRKIGVAEGNDDVWGPQGNFAGDTKVELGGVSIKPISKGDMVKYFGEPAEVVELSKDKKVARITFKNRALTQNVKTSDLKKLGQGVAEMDGDGAGRDGSNRKRISSYGTRDRDIPGPDVHLGPEHVMTPKKVVKHGVSALHKAWDAALKDTPKKRKNK